MLPVNPETSKFKQPWREYFESLDRAMRALIRLSGTGAITVAELPSAAVAGARAFVTDANDTTFNSIVAGGGTDAVPVVSDGTNWLIG